MLSSMSAWLAIMLLIVLSLLPDVLLVALRRPRGRNTRQSAFLFLPPCRAAGPATPSFLWDVHYLHAVPDRQWSQLLLE
ncbi:hypothetical protein Z043_102554 [Scleropages formosus]|uniref:Uncharacterized protein n=1 Tax=Scleropages formosus TaxID=113540 RepID=A0A0P7V744_SCLFO|nr:hypothetical protein Z043_102554 [Scleropages formosus]